MDILVNFAAGLWEMKWWIIAAYAAFFFGFLYEVRVAPLVGDDEYRD